MGGAATGVAIENVAVVLVVVVVVSTGVAIANGMDSCDGFFADDPPMMDPENPSSSFVTSFWPYS